MLAIERERERERGGGRIHCKIHAEAEERVLIEAVCVFCVRDDPRNSWAGSIIQPACSAQVGEINTCSALKIRK